MPNVRELCIRNINPVCRAGLGLALLTLGLAAHTATAASVEVEWDPTTLRIDDSPVLEITGYRLYFGTAPGEYEHMVEVGTTTASVVEGLADGQDYYFAATALDSYGTESGFSEEMVWSTLNQDADALPDAWEEAQFGSVDVSSGGADEDTDLDGMSDLAEMIAGTAANNPEDVLKIQVAMVDGQCRVSFTATRAEGPGYEGIQRKFAIEAASNGAFIGWTPVTGMPVAGDNQVVELTPVAAEVVSAFRLKCWLE
jgi:hypothetical protein